AQVRHIRLIDADLRARDRIEIIAAWGEPKAAMAVCLANSFYARTAFHELEPLAMYGLAPLSMLASHARAWCFGTQAIDRHRIAFARASRLALYALFGHCSLMTNVIDKNDAAAVRWVQWLGGSLVTDREFQHREITFQQFVIAGGRAKCHRV